MWAIRQKSTGYWMPKLPDKYRAGGTWREPEPDCIPRLFTTSRGAERALQYWLRGQAIGAGVWMGQQNMTFTRVASRDPNDMEIVEVEICPVSP